MGSSSTIFVNPLLFVKKKNLSGLIGNCRRFRVTKVEGEKKVAIAAGDARIEFEIDFSLC